MACVADASSGSNPQGRNPEGVGLQVVGPPHQTALAFGLTRRRRLWPVSPLCPLPAHRLQALMIPGFSARAKPPRHPGNDRPC